MWTTASSFTATKPSCMTTTSSSTSVLLKLHAPSDDVGNISLDEPGRMYRESVQLCKTNIIFMWPLSWQGMLYIFIKATLYIFNTITLKSFQWITSNVTKKSPSWQTNSCSATHSIPCLYKTCQFITIFTTARLTPSHLMSLAHISSVLTHIVHWKTMLLWPICLLHFERHADTPKCWTKNETLTNNRTPDLTYSS